VIVGGAFGGSAGDPASPVGPGRDGLAPAGRYRTGQTGVTPCLRRENDRSLVAAAR
jgi:hypothetical protein